MSSVEEDGMATPKGKGKDLEEVEERDDALEIDDLEEDALDGDLESDDPDDGDLEDALEDDSLGIEEGESFDDDDDDDDEDDDSTPRARKVKNDDDDEDVEPEDVEADLDAILRDRMATMDDEDDDDDDGSSVVSKGVAPADVVTCSSCFLGVNTSQLSNKDYCPHCGDQLVGA